MPANASIAELPAKLQQGVALHQLGRLSEAQGIYVEILKMQADNADALHLMGVIAAQTGNPERAVELIGKAIAVNPGNAAAHLNQALALRELKQWNAALMALDRAIAIKGDFAEAFSNRGVVLMELKELDAALASFDRAIAINPAFAEALCSRGLALMAVKDLDAALASFNRAVALKGNLAEAFSNRGIVQKERGQLDAALASCNQAISINGNFAEAFYNRGIVQKALRQVDAALASYNRAIEIKSDYAEAHFDRGNALKDLKQWDAALASYNRAIAIRSDYAEAYNNCGNVLRDLKRYQAAIESYDRAIALNGNSRYAKAMRLYAKMHACNWGNWDAEIAELAARIDRGEAASHPFCIMALSGSAALQRRAAEAWAHNECPPSNSLPAMAKRAKRDKLRIGYFSADFRNHPVAILTAELFETHDRSRFESIAFSFGHDTRDEMRKRLESAFDRFIDVRSKADADIALLARSLEIDIAVDLGGFTADARPGIFAARAAPLQVSYLGYLGTMAAPYIDYLIADAMIIPAEHQRYYSEKIVYLPSYQANDSKRRIAVKEFTREALGLPSTGFVFCCFNSNFKIAPGTFDSWMRILRRTKGSVLFLYAGGDPVEANLRSEAVKRGVDPDRLIFGGQLPFPEYLARYRAADLFLDTLPYNAGTTASDALWAGLPVLTCIGEAFAGRVAASVLNAIRLPELIASSPQQYEDLAVELAVNTERLAEIKQKLSDNRLTAPLFDTPLFTTHLEMAFTQMHERYQADLPIDHIDIGAIRAGTTSRLQNR